MLLLCDVKATHIAEVLTSDVAREIRVLCAFVKLWIAFAAGERGAEGGESEKAVEEGPPGAPDSTDALPQSTPAVEPNERCEETTTRRPVVGHELCHSSSFWLTVIEQTKFLDNCEENLLGPFVVQGALRTSCGSRG